MPSLFGLYPFLKKILADGGYSGKTFHEGLEKACGHSSVEIVKRSETALGFEVLLKP